MKVFMRILSRACREKLQRKVLQYFNLLCGLWVGGRLLAGWGWRGWGVVGLGRGGRLWAAAGGLGGGWRAVGCVLLAGFGWAFFSLVETLVGF